MRLENSHTENVIDFVKDNFIHVFRKLLSISIIISITLNKREKFKMQFYVHYNIYNLSFGNK